MNWIDQEADLKKRKSRFNPKSKINLESAEVFPADWRRLDMYCLAVRG